MANTTNFGWETPDDTDLVKDGAAAIRTLGSAIDTSLVDLKGGTTGQVLSKASGTDMDFTWVAQDDSNAIQNALLTTTGDTIYASGASTPARLGIGTSGQVLTVSGGVPSWATPTSGSMTLISTTTLSSTQVNLTSIPTTYNDLKLVIRNFKPTTDSRRILMQLNGDTNARYNNTGWTDSSNFTFGNAQIDVITPVNDNINANGLTIVDIFDYTNTTTWKTLLSFGIGNDATTSTNHNTKFTAGFYNQTAAITQINLFINSSDTFAGGTVLLYGVK